MPSTYKTEHLGLNRWLGSDKPKRTDFNEDNERIDAAVAGHIADHVAHVTEAERARWDAPFVTGSYTGDGTAERAIQLGFRPSALIVCIASKAPINVSSSDVQLRFAFATEAGASKGVALSDEGFWVYNPSVAPLDGETPRLNIQNSMYFYIAYR